MPRPRPPRAAAIRIALTTLALAACASPPDAVRRVSIRDIPLHASRLVDVLFVIDSGPTMADARASLAANAPKFVDVLEQIGAIDLQLAVTTADGSGALSGAGCAGLAPGARWIRDARRGDLTIRDYAGDLRDVFACAAAVGTGGPAVRQPLASLRRAIERNPGVVRADAQLYVVVISDGDDCSPRDGAAALTDPFACVEAAWTCDEPDLRAPGDKHGCHARAGSPSLADVDDTVRFLRDLKAPAAIRIAAVIGPDAPVVVAATPDGPALAPSCASATATARPALRVHALIDATDPSPLVPSLCAADFSDALAGLGSLGDVEDPVCFEDTPRDADPSTPELEPDCVMTLVRDGNTGHARDTDVPRCDPRRYATPCWQLTASPVVCQATASQLQLDVDFGDQPVPADVILHAACAIA